MRNLINGSILGDFEDLFKPVERFPKTMRTDIILEENDKFCKNTESNIDTIYIAYYAGGIFNIYINWLKKEIIATEEELAEKIHNITNSFMY